MENTIGGRFEYNGSIESMIREPAFPEASLPVRNVVVDILFWNGHIGDDILRPMDLLIYNLMYDE